MAGMGLIGAGGAAGTYEGLRDWMQGRRQKVVQGQRDEDRLREQALQNQALATEAADREYDMARQRVIDTRTATKEAQAEAARAALMEGIDAIDDPRVTPVHKMMARFDAQQGKVSPLIEDALKAVKPNYDIAPSGELVDVNDPKNLGRNFAAPVKPNYDIAPSGELIDVNDPKNIGRNFAAPRQAADPALTIAPSGEVVDLRDRSNLGKSYAKPESDKGSAKITGLQRKALGYYNRAQEASKTVEELEPIIAKSGLASDVQLAYAPNFAQTPVQQQYRQGQRAFTEARLRKDSGAAVPQSEHNNDAKTYFAQPNDSDATIEKKRRGRQRVLESIKFESGDAYEEFYGEPNTPPGRTAAAKTVTRAQLDALARKRGTDVATQAARAAANGYTVAD